MIEFESYYLFRTDIRQFQADSDLVEKTTSIRELLCFWPESLRYGMDNEQLSLRLKKWFDSGDECFVVREDKIVAMAWVGYQNNFMLRDMAAKVGLGPREAISHRHYVNKEHRGNGYQVALKDHIYAYLRDKGFETVYTYVGTHNIASIINHMRTEDQYRLLYHLKIRGRFNLFPFGEGWRCCA